MAADCEVWLADPARGYQPRDGLERIGHYTVPTTRELEDQTERAVTLFRLLP
jgi:predicted nicotinamide N-methyase